LEIPFLPVAAFRSEKQGGLPVIATVVACYYDRRF
jgi:hypothetical protein